MGDAVLPKFSRPLTPSLLVWAAILALAFHWFLDDLASTVVGHFFIRLLAYAFDSTDQKVVEAITSLAAPLLLGGFSAYAIYLTGKKVGTEANPEAGDHGIGETHELIDDAEFYDVTNADGFLIVKRKAKTPFTINLPAHPLAGKNIDIGRSSDDLSSHVVVNGRGRKVGGYDPFSMNFVPQTITVRFSGSEWVIT